MSVHIETCYFFGGGQILSSRYHDDFEEQRFILIRLCMIGCTPLNSSYFRLQILHGIRAGLILSHRLFFSTQSYSSNLCLNTVQPLEWLPTHHPLLLISSSHRLHPLIRWRCFRNYCLLFCQYSHKLAHLPTRSLVPEPWLTKVIF